MSIHFFHEIPKEIILPFLLSGREIVAAILYMKQVLFLTLTASVYSYWAQICSKLFDGSGLRRFIEFSAELVLGLSASDALLITVFGSSKSNLMLTTISFVFNRSRIPASMLACWRAFERRAKMPLTTSAILCVDFDCCSRVETFSDGKINCIIFFVGLCFDIDGRFDVSGDKRMEFLIRQNLSR